MKIGIFGGSFDPPHLGHLILAEQARIAKNLDKIIFVPSGISPHKKEITLAKHRFIMTKIAIKGNDFFEVSDLEIKKQEISYTIDTIKYFEKIYSQIYYIIGQDWLENIKTWKDWQQILKIAKFLVGQRQSAEREIDKEILENIEFFPMPIIEISSTDIRQRVKNSSSIKYLVPTQVRKYIYKHHLYH